MKVLIVTHSQDDEGIDNVISKLHKEGADTFRFNTNLYPTQIELSSHYTRHTEEIIIAHKGKSYNLSTFDAIWYRRDHIGEGLPKEMPEVHRLPAIDESRATFDGMLVSWGVDKFTLDNIRDYRYADNKQLQLKVAKRLGLTIPQTMFSNSPEQVKVFIHQFPVVISKTHFAFTIINAEKEEYKVFTQKWLPHELGDLEGLELSPLIFQEYIEKAYELRVVIVGNQVFSAKINSQASEKGKADWRKDQSLLESMKPYKLPEGIKQKLLRLMDYFSLNYGAIDMIKTPEGDFVFLEINPVGEFHWVDELYDQKISQAIAQVLMNQVWRRN